MLRCQNPNQDNMYKCHAIYAGMTMLYLQHHNPLISTKERRNIASTSIAQPVTARLGISSVSKSFKKIETKVSSPDQLIWMLLHQPLPDRRGPSSSLLAHNSFWTWRKDLRSTSIVSEMARSIFHVSFLSLSNVLSSTVDYCSVPFERRTWRLPYRRCTIDVRAFILMMMVSWILLISW